MEIKDAVASLSALAQETRLTVFRMLVEAGPEGMKAGAIASALGVPAATLSFHVAQLARAGLVTARQESRFVYYAANFPAMDDLIAYLTDNCCQGGACLPKTAAVGVAARCQPKAADRPSENPVISEPMFNVLFLCTGNSARSILAEAILNHVGGGRFRAFSAGSHPGGSVNPYAIELLAGQGLAVADLRSKSWDEFAAAGAPHIDFVFTVCDNAAGEVCPVWPGRPIAAHWGIEDPAAVGGSDEDKRKAFSKAFAEMNRRISLFVGLPLVRLDAMALKRELDGIGRLREQGEQP